MEVESSHCLLVLTQCYFLVSKTPDGWVVELPKFRKMFCQDVYFEGGDLTVGSESGKDPSESRWSCLSLCLSLFSM